MALIAQVNDPTRKRDTVGFATVLNAALWRLNEKGRRLSKQASAKMHHACGRELCTDDALFWLPSRCAAWDAFL
jgi:hypothetical protein